MKLSLRRIFEIPDMPREEVARKVSRILAEHGDNMLGTIPTPEEVIKNPERYYILYDMETGDFVGVGAIRIRTGEIMKVVIKREYRGKGLGRFLLGMIIEEGIRNGVELFTVFVRKDNEAMRKLVESMGFEEICEHPKEDRVLIEYKLKIVPRTGRYASPTVPADPPPDSDNYDEYYDEEDYDSDTF
ncbi:MAG: hypothetical protein DRO23_10775 [Thermoprotei archaeon]|nr:MAG: hypothetical protein DRO23_10775 [Thermoprotei archaeon]